MTKAGGDLRIAVGIKGSGVNAILAKPETGVGGTCKIGALPHDADRQHLAGDGRVGSTGIDYLCLHADKNAEHA